MLSTPQFGVPENLSNFLEFVTVSVFVLYPGEWKGYKNVVIIKQEIQCLFYAQEEYIYMEVNSLSIAKYDGKMPL